MLQSIKKGFTLIELLVVITIIGILATGAVSVYTTQIQKARDTNRITDTKSLQGAIEQAYQDNSVYPLADATNFNGAIDVYMPNMVEDIKNGTGCQTAGSNAQQNCGYVYNVNTSGITQSIYEISTTFENQANVDNKAFNTSDNGNDHSRLELSNDFSESLVTGWMVGSADPLAGAYNVVKPTP